MPILTIAVPGVWRICWAMSGNGPQLPFMGIRGLSSFPIPVIRKPILMASIMCYGEEVGLLAPGPFAIVSAIGILLRFENCLLGFGYVGDDGGTTESRRTRRREMEERDEGRLPLWSRR